MLLKRQDIFPQEEICFHLNNCEHYFPHLHGHDFYEIFVILEGRCFHCFNGKEELLPAGSAMLISPKDFHRLCIEKDCLALNIAFSVELMQKVSSLLCLDCSTDSQIHLLPSEEISYLYRESKKSAAFQGTEQCLLLKAMLVNCISHFMSFPVLADSPEPEWLSLLVSKLSLPENFSKETKEICLLAGYTPAYVSRCFRKYLHTTLTEYLQKMRLNYARGLLVSTSLPILMICFESGFHNLSYFYRCFHQVYGLSPKRYRDQYRIIL